MIQATMALEESGATYVSVIADMNIFPGVETSSSMHLQKTHTEKTKQHDLDAQSEFQAPEAVDWEGRKVEISGRVES
jgi:hypothetical protein